MLFPTISSVLVMTHEVMFLNRRYYDQLQPRCVAARDRSIYQVSDLQDLCPRGSFRRCRFADSSRPPSCPTLNLLFPPVAACNFHENAKPGRDTHGDRRASSPRTNQGTSGYLSGPALSWSGQRQPSGSLRKHRILTTSAEPFRGFLPFSFRVQMIWNGTEKGWGRKIQTHLPA